MNYTVRLSRDARNYVRRADNVAKGRFRAALRELGEDPFHSGTKGLATDPPRRSARVGRWRIVYWVDVEARIVGVAAIGPRGQIYRDL